jgi:hypothetical protein
VCVCARMALTHARGIKIYISTWKDIGSQTVNLFNHFLVLASGHFPWDVESPVFKYMPIISRGKGHLFQIKLVLPSVTSFLWLSCPLSHFKCILNAAFKCNTYDKSDNKLKYTNLFLTFVEPFFKSKIYYKQLTKNYFRNHYIGK